jgi:chromosome segregation ATPase
MIKRIQIDNFKSFGKVDIEPRPGVNLLIGPNKVGHRMLLCFENNIGYHA